MDSTQSTAARFVGRVGALAVALGVGVVIGGYGVASADTGSETDTSDGPSAAESRGAAKRGAVTRQAAATPAEPGRVTGRQGAEAQSDPRRGGRGSRIVTTPAAPAATANQQHTPSIVKAPQSSGPTDRVPTSVTTMPVTTASAAAVPTPAGLTPATTGMAAVTLRSMPAPVAAPIAQAPVPATTAVAPASAALAAVLVPLSGVGGGLPLQSPAPWAALAVARRLGRLEARSPATRRAVATVASSAATTGTTTKITWAWGTNPVLNFNPATDKLDFGWMAASAFDVTETSGSTKIAVVGNNHSYTLQNVPLAQLTMTNIVAKDAGTVSKWQGLIAGAQTVTTPTVSIANATVAEGNSGTTNAAFTVTLSKASTRPVTVGYNTANGTATAGSDFTATSGTLTFAAGVTSAKVNVAVLGDTAVEANEAFTVTLSAPSGATLGTATATGTITNDDTAVVVTPPTLSIANATVAEGNSGSAALAFTVSLSKTSDKTVTVGYSTANGTATAGQDYTAKSGTLTFAPGTTTQQVSVAVTGDTAVEPSESLTVTLAGPTNATLSTATATGTITNDDTTTTPPPPATADRWGNSFYAPYVDMGGWPVPDLLAIAKSSGATLFTAAFMQSTPDGKAAWAGLNALEPGAANDQARAINTSIKAIQDAGGDVMISLGGAAGTSLAQYYQARGLSAQALADAYAGVVDTYKINHLDFDIEGAAVAEPASITLHSQALKLLQQSKPDLKVWYTLPVLPTGLTADGVNVVDSAMKAGVTLAGVNIMAMDYGESAAPTSGPNAKTMGAYAIAAAESTYAQLNTLYSRYGKTYGYKQLGVTPMIGVNDVLSEVFTLADAQALEDFARAKGLGMLSFWSVTRDTPGALGQATPTASGLNVPAGSFSGVFKDYGTQNTVSQPPSGGTTGGGTTTPVTGGTTTKIGWNWGSNAVLNFDPAKDKLDFVWMGPDSFGISEKSGSTVITIVNNNQTYTLSGVALNRMSTGNIVALDTATVAKWQSAISAAGQVTTPPTITAPTVSIANATVAEGNSGSRNLAFTASLSKASTSAVSVNYATSNGTATAGQDYTAASGTVTFAPGVLSQQVNVVVTGDTTVEPAETLTVTLSNPTGATLATATATGTITNDDTAPATVTPPTISVANTTVAEGNSGSRTLAFAVSLSKASTTAVSVNYTTSNGTATAGQDYTAASGTVTFAPGVLSQQVNVVVTGDTTVEPAETLTVTLSNPTGATLATATATGTITNDDTTGGTVPPPATALPIAAHDKVLAAYFPEWGIYGRNFQVADIPGDQLTHVIYSFLNVTPAGEVALYDSFAAVEKRFAANETVSGEADLWYYPPTDPRSQQTVWGNFNQLSQLKQKYPHLKVSVAVGGWTLSSNFSTVTATAAGREKLANSVVNFLDTYQMFDGVDFDWEYPGGGGLGGNSVSPNDGANYAELLKLVRAKLDVLGQQRGRTYQISVASPAGYDKIANFNLAGLAPSVDFFNLMSYDFHGTWEKTTGHQSAFTGDPNGYDIKSAVGLYLAAGVPAAKIVLGAPLYTRGWSGVADGGDGGYLAPASGSAPGTFEAGVYDYKDLLAALKDPASGWKLYWDDAAQAAYLYNASRQLFSSFETPTSIAQKSDWAEAIGLGGMMFWDISNDAVGSPDSLVRAAYSSWVLDKTIAAIRSGAPLPNEVIIGGDGVIAALPTGLPGGTAL